MIFWIFVILFIFGIVLSVVANIFSEKTSCANIWICCDLFLDLILPIFLSVCGTIIAVMLLFILIIQVHADGSRAENEARYESLIYKLQSESSRDRFGILNKEYMDEVQSWNEDLAKYQTNSHNFWIGIFYPDRAITGVELIELEDMRFRN